MPGTSLRLLVEVGGVLEVVDARVATAEPDGIAVIGATARAEPFRFGAGASAEIHFERDRRRYSFQSQAVELMDDARTAIFSPPEALESIDRRAGYRLDIALRPFRVFPLVVDQDCDDSRFRESVVVDLSCGGVCVVSSDPAEDGEFLGIEFNVPPLGELNARLQVVRRELPRLEGRKHRLHCAFVGLSRQDEDKVHRFLLNRQMALRRWGQL